MPEPSKPRWSRDALEGRLSFDFASMTCTVDDAVFDLRRSGDGYWEARPKAEHWQRSIDRVKEALATPIAHDADKDDYEELTGEHYDTAAARGIDVLTRLPGAPWEGLGDVVPVAEAAYQDYLRRK